MESPARANRNLTASPASGVRPACDRMSAWVILAAVLLVLGPGCETAPAYPIPETLIGAAGNAATEAERYTLLQEARAAAFGRGRADLVADLDGLLPVIDLWANGLDHWQPGDQENSGEEGYLAGFFVWEVFPEGAGEVYPPEVDGRGALFPIWAMYRGRMLIQQGIQNGLLVSTDVLEDAYFGEGRRLVEVAERAYPDNPVLPIYLDTPVPWVQVADPEFPAWAVAQRDALQKLSEIAEYWVLKRQAPDGQIGGGWGDDVEVWRNLTPLLLGLDHELATELVTNVAAGIWRLPRLEGGYTSVLTDVEHSAEDTGDSLTSMGLLYPEDSAWAARTDALAALADGVWLRENARGNRQFSSTFITSDGVSDTLAYACDTAYHSRVMQPVLLRWQQTGDPALRDLITAWLTGWVEASASGERGKPEGVLPTAIRWPDGAPGGPGDDWWDPGCAPNAGAFDWPSQLASLTRALVLAEYMTGDASWFEPVRVLAELRRDHYTSPEPDASPGALGWVARKAGFLDAPLGKRRILTGDSSWDDVLIAESSAYVGFRITGDRGPLTAALTATSDAFAVNEAAYMEEVRWTDRIFAFTKNYANRFAEPPLLRPSPSLLYETLTGDFGDATYLPLPAVRWATFPEHFAALVTDATPDRFAAEIVNFWEGGREIPITLLRLEGDAPWSMDCGEVTTGTVVGGLATLRIPPRSACILTVGATEGN